MFSNKNISSEIKIQGPGFFKELGKNKTKQSGCFISNICIAFAFSNFSFSLIYFSDQHLSDLNIYFHKNSNSENTEIVMSKVTRTSSKMPLASKGKMAKVLASIREEEDPILTVYKKPATGREKAVKVLTSGDHRQTSCMMPSAVEMKVVKVIGSIRKEEVIGSIRKDEDPNKTVSKMPAAGRERAEKPLMSTSKQEEVMNPKMKSAKKAKVVPVLQSTRMTVNFDQGKMSPKTPSTGKGSTVKVLRSARKADNISPKLKSPKVPSAGKEKVGKVQPPAGNPAKKEKSKSFKDLMANGIPEHPSEELMIKCLLHLRERIERCNKNAPKCEGIFMHPRDSKWLSDWKKTTDTIFLWIFSFGIIFFIVTILCGVCPPEWIQKFNEILNFLVEQFYIFKHMINL